MARPQLVTGQERGEDHDEQGPEIVNEVGLGRGRELERREIQHRVANRSEEAKQKEEGRRADEREPPLRERSEEPHRSANEKRHGGELQWRHRTGGRGQQGEQGPQRDRQEAVGGASCAGHVIPRYRIMKSGSGVRASPFSVPPKRPSILRPSTAEGVAPL